MKERKNRKSYFYFNKVLPHSLFGLLRLLSLLLLSLVHNNHSDSNYIASSSSRFFCWNPQGNRKEKNFSFFYQAQFSSSNGNISIGGGRSFCMFELCAEKSDSQLTKNRTKTPRLYDGCATCKSFSCLTQKDTLCWGPSLFSGEFIYWFFVIACEVLSNKSAFFFCKISAKAHRWINFTGL